MTSVKLKLQILVHRKLVATLNRFHFYSFNE